MILSILFILMIVAFSVYLAVYLSDDLFDAIMAGLLGLCLVFLGGLIVLLICGGISEAVPERENNIEIAETHDIKALEDNQSASGRFFLGSGYVKSDLYYYYITETEHGYKADKVKADECHLVYTDDDFRIERYKAHSFKHWYTYIYAVPVYEYYVIYIPQGSITTQFNVDLMG